MPALALRPPSWPIRPAAARGFSLEGRPYAGELRATAGPDGALRLENRLPASDYLEGVLAAEVSYERREAVVEYDPAKTSPEKIVAAVEKLGYKAAVKA